MILGHWKKLHSKVSQGGARGACMNISSKVDKNFIQMLSIIIWINAPCFINFEENFVMLFNDKVSKNAPKHEIV